MHALQAGPHEEEDDDTCARLPKRRRRAWEEPEDGEGEGSDAEAERAAAAAEAAREADLRERAEFEERLRARDEAKTRKIAEAKLSKEEVAVRRAARSVEGWGRVFLVCVQSVPVECSRALSAVKRGGHMRMLVFAGNTVRREFAHDAEVSI